MKQILCCPLCGSAVADAPIMSVVNKRCIGQPTYTYVSCARCDLSFLNPMPSQAELDLLYADEYDMCEESGGRGASYVVGNWLSEPRDLAVSRLCAPGRILDVGCGSGVFAAKMKERGWDAYGLEVSRESLKRSAQQLGGDRVFPGWDEASFPDGYFDVVTLWHVLEHLQGPGTVADKISRVLKKGGFVLIEVPNRYSLALRIFKGLYEHHRIPEHLLYWSNQSLEYLFSKDGFSIVSIKYPMMWPLSLSRGFVNSLGGAGKRWSVLVILLCAPVSFLNAVVGSIVGTGEFIRLVARKV